MTSKLTRERLGKIKSWRETYGAGSNVMLPAEEAEELARMALAAMDSEPVAIENFRSAMEGIGHIRRTLEETFGGLHGTHVEPDVLIECKTICDAIYAAYSGSSPVIPDGKSVTASTGIPVIPDGYVMVPKEPTQAMCAAFNDSDYGRKSLRERYVAMLAAAQHDTPALNSLQSVDSVADTWIPVSERMPETDGNYWGWWSESKRQGPVWFIKSELQAQFQSHEITHWMPLPAAPQEPKP